MDYFEKYIKYKNKYMTIKNNFVNQIGGRKNRIPNKIIQIDLLNKKNYEWRTNLPLVKFSKKNKIKFYDIENKVINLTSYEIFEQYLVSKWIKPDDIVLELGGRYGIVSCTINMLLDNENKNKHVVIEPDDSIIKILFKNRKITKSKFSIFKYPINDNEIIFYKSEQVQGLANFVVNLKNKPNSSNDKYLNNFEEIKLKNITHNDFFNKFKQKFNVLIADCEGCLCDFFSQNNKILEQLEMIIFELDNENICNYNNVYNLLEKNNFILIDSINTKKWNNDDTYEITKFQQVWTKKY